MNSENNIYSVSLEKKEIIIEKSIQKKTNDAKIDELIKSVNKLSKKYDFFNRQISKNNALQFNSQLDDKLDDLINNVANFSNSIDKEIIQNGNINSKKYNNLEYI